jgi:hypothetical protein
LGGSAGIRARAGTIVFTCCAQAMPIRQFDKMAGQDQDNYVGDLIIVAVKTLLDGLGADDGCDPEK